MSLFRYAADDVAFPGVDITAVASLSIDLRAECGAGKVPDETVICPPGTFSRSVCAPLPGAHPIGEIRIWLGGREVRIVGALTGRPGVLELTPEHLAAAEGSADYRAQLLGALGFSS